MPRPGRGNKKLFPKNDVFLKNRQTSCSQTEGAENGGAGATKNVLLHMSCMYFHSLPSARVVSVGPVCDPQNLVGVISLTGRIQKDKARRVHTSNTVCVQEYHVHSNVDGLRVLPADFLSPHRHHFVHPWSVRTNGYRAHHRLRSYARCLHTYIPQVHPKTLFEIWLNA